MGQLLPQTLAVGIRGRYGLSEISTLSQIATPHRTGPSINKGKSKQDYVTPSEFIQTVEKRFGHLVVDLAATSENKRAPEFISEAENSLADKWQWRNYHGLCWLNPPFAHIAPWARKCQVESLMGAKILMLVPASVGSNWFADHIHGRAHVMFLSPRIQFEGAEDPYPRDLMCVSFGIQSPEYECWRWK